MKISNLKDKSQVAEFASRWCQFEVEKNGANSFFLPAGGTPTELYQKWESEHPSFLNGLEFIQIDEVKNGKKAGLFKGFFEEHLPSYQNQFQWIGEGRRSADVAILGLGLNGHVAFHEPGVPTNFKYGEVELSPRTIKSLDLESDAKGISYGLGSFLECRSILLMVNGHSKRSILQKVLAGDRSIPAGILRYHPNLTIVCDSQALPDKVNLDLAI